MLAVSVKFYVTPAIPLPEISGILSGRSIHRDAELSKVNAERF